MKRERSQISVVEGCNGVIIDIDGASWSKLNLKAVVHGGEERNRTKKIEVSSCAGFRLPLLVIATRVNLVFPAHVTDNFPLLVSQESSYRSDPVQMDGCCVLLILATTVVTVAGGCQCGMARRRARSSYMQDSIYSHDSGRINLG